MARADGQTQAGTASRVPGLLANISRPKIKRQTRSPADEQSGGRPQGGSPLQQADGAHQAGWWLRDRGREVSEVVAAGVSQALLVVVRKRAV